MTVLAPVCILTAGQGTRMGPFAAVINKALLPYKGKALISHIIESFPAGTPFVIALGYLQQQVRDYLQISHPNLPVSFVEVDNYAGDGSGPGYSLYCCRNLLQQPFYFVSCDTLFDINLEQAPIANWVGVACVAQDARANYCNMLVTNGNVTRILDKQIVTDESSVAFSGLMYIQDYAIFWSALEDERSIAGERQVSNGLLGLIADSSLQCITVSWLDLGTYEQYQQAVEETAEYNFSKTNEFLYVTNQQVIKFFADESITAGRVEKAALKPQVFPRITAAMRQWYSYDFVQGETMYAYNHPQLFDKLLLWLEQDLWTPVAVTSSQMQALCRTFYRDKTLARLADYNKKYPKDIKFNTVNGCNVAGIETLMNDIPWHELSQGIPTFMHGDLQFDNILYDKTSNNFILLDWRQDFAGEVSFGDIYYDLAKLMGGIIINYDYIKAGLFNVSADGDALRIDFAQRFNGAFYLQSLNQFFVRHGYDAKRVKILVGLIYLNMSPLHHPPFDRALHGLGRLLLTEELYGTKDVVTRANSSMVIPA